MELGAADADGGFAEVLGDELEHFLGGACDDGAHHEAQGHRAGPGGGLRGEEVIAEPNESIAEPDEDVEEGVGGGGQRRPAFDEHHVAQDADDDGGDAGKDIDDEAYEVIEPVIACVFGEVDAGEHADGDADDGGHGDEDEGSGDAVSHAADGIGGAWEFGEESDVDAGDSAVEDVAEDEEEVAMVSRAKQ